MSVVRTPDVDWLSVVRRFVPRIEAERERANRERQFSSELIRAMAGAGLFKLKVAARYSGAELDYVTFFQLLEELARTDASAAWLVMIGNENSSCTGYLPAETVEELYADPGAIIASGLKSRQAEVQRVDGGYRLRGQWTLASGSPEAAWFGAAAVLPDESGAGGRPDVRLLLVPRQECLIVDTWDALGLRATASHDFVVQDAFVPEPYQLRFPGARSELPGPLWRGDVRSHLGGPGAVALGIARAALDEFIALAQSKVPLLSQSTLRDRPTAQLKLGQAEALVRSARAFLYESLAAMWHTQSQGDPPTEEQVMLRELATVQAVQSCAHAVEMVYDAAGSDAVYTSSTIERCFRDVHVVTQHVAGATSRFELVGRFLMIPR
jgi:alkylation response protein AidB-like acyl-CoA dehydrogenase